MPLEGAAGEAAVTSTTGRPVLAWRGSDAPGAGSAPGRERVDQMVQDGHDRPLPLVAPGPDDSAAVEQRAECPAADALQEAGEEVGLQVEQLPVEEDRR